MRAPRGYIEGPTDVWEIEALPEFVAKEDGEDRIAREVPAIAWDDPEGMFDGFLTVAK